MLTFFLIFISCTEEEPKTLDTSTQETEDVLDTMEEYITSYCSVYSMRCGGVYASQEECETDISEMWADKECYVSDVPLLQECIDWLSEFPCEETGWDDSCDNFYTCD